MPQIFRKIGALVGGLAVFAVLLVAVHLAIGAAGDLLLLAGGVVLLAYWLKNQIWPSDYYTRTEHGQCPHCGCDLRQVRKGETYCPQCGEVIPAPLRKW